MSPKVQKTSNFIEFYKNRAFNSFSSHISGPCQLLNSIPVTSAGCPTSAWFWQMWDTAGPPLKPFAVWQFYTGKSIEFYKSGAFDICGARLGQGRGFRNSTSAKTGQI